MRHSIILAAQGAPAKGWTARLRTHGWALLGLLLCQLGQVSASLLLPWFSADVIDKGIAAKSPDTILSDGGVMGAASLVQLVLSVGAVVLGALISFLSYVSLILISTWSPPRNAATWMVLYGPWLGGYDTVLENCWRVVITGPAPTHDHCPRLPSGYAHPGSRRGDEFGRHPH
jgi:hypothetical protein